MVAMGIASSTVPSATAKLFRIFEPRFQGCSNTVCRFSSVGVKISAVSSEYTSRGNLKAVMAIQAIGRAMALMPTKTSIWRSQPAARSLAGAR